MRLMINFSRPVEVGFFFFLQHSFPVPFTLVVNGLNALKYHTKFFNGLYILNCFGSFIF